jgi:hypothetical protein
VNRAIFLYTLYVRMRSLPVLGTVAFFCVLAPAILTCATLFGSSEMEASVLTLVLGSPAVAFVLAFTILRDSFADTRNMNDGEYLTLLFTRPVSRAEYVFTKWLATSAAVAIALFIQVLIFHIGQMIQHIDDSYIWNAASLINVLLNALSSSALISAINAFPRKYAIYLFLITSYASVLGKASNTSWRNETAFVGDHKQITDQLDVPSLISTVLNTRIDAFDLLHANVFPWLDVVGYLSNMSLYLLLAVFLLTRREFFYGSE